MKLFFLVLILIMAVPMIAQAKCACVCENGISTSICDNANDPLPFCGMCPMSYIPPLSPYNSNPYLPTQPVLPMQPYNNNNPYAIPNPWNQKP